jgi:hypothetical protein
VQDARDFRVASRIFWCATFAIQRGIPDVKVKQSLWDQIWGSKLPRAYKTAVAEVDARKSWEFEEAFLLGGFTQKFVAWKDAWVGSSAGQEYTRVAEQKRYAMSVRLG